jgi:hypothetical protein
VKGGVRSWIAARRSDPVPVLLTIGGCVISLVSLIFGMYSDVRGVASNVIADLILIGPALFLSNIIVKRIQDGRVRERIAPLLNVIAQLLYRAVATTRQALEMLETGAQLDLPVAVADQMTLSSVESVLARALTELDAATHSQPLPATLPTSQPLSFPRFGMIRRLVQQADQDYPMPWVTAAANIAEDWAERCGVAFLYSRPDGSCLRRRVVGLTQVEEQSKGAAAATRLDTESYLQAVRGCLHSAHGVARRLAEEAPKGLTHVVGPSLIDIGKTVPWVP